MKRRVALVVLIVLVVSLIAGCAKKEPTVEELLAKKGYEVSNDHFLRSARFGDVEAVALFLDAGIYIDVREMSDQWVGATALMYACDRERKDVVEYLIEQGADIEAKADNGYNPLYTAVTVGNVEITKILIDNGVEVSFRVGFNTPLHSAIFNKNLEIIKLLVDAGADMEIRGTMDYQTPLMQAIDDEKVEIVEYLLSKGADANAKDIIGRDILGLTENKEIKELLKKYR